MNHSNHDPMHRWVAVAALSTVAWAGCSSHAGTRADATGGEGGTSAAAGSGGPHPSGGSSGMDATGGGAGASGSTGGASGEGGIGGTGAATKMRLGDVSYWAYEIQHLDTPQQRDELTGTHFDLYVLEVTTTEAGNQDFDIAGLISDIRQNNIQRRGIDPLILAYVDVGQAEAWRWYFDPSWTIGNPDWIVADDPNGWRDNFVVAYWDAAWEDIVIYGDSMGRSHVQETLDQGFDGIYMDWVEAFSDDRILERIQTELGLSPSEAQDRAAVWMLDFIEKIRDYAQGESPTPNPDYLVVAQNASDLHGFDPSRYESLMDAIALEAIWVDGNGGFDDWDDPDGYNVMTNDLVPGWTEEVLSHLQPMKGSMPIFCVEYAQDMDGQNMASEVFDVLAPAEGFIPYATRRSLQRLSSTPYPPGYDPIDY